MVTQRNKNAYRKKQLKNNEKTKHEKNKTLVFPHCGGELSVWAAHDTTMIPVLVILGCYDFLWPPIASELRLELWECHEHEEHLVRVVFNDKPLKLPFAAARDDFCEVSMLCQALRAKMPDTRASL